jgi:hypothetical protein
MPWFRIEGTLRAERIGAGRRANPRRPPDARFALRHRIAGGNVSRNGSPPHGGVTIRTCSGQSAAGGFHVPSASNDHPAARPRHGPDDPAAGRVHVMRLPDAVPTVRATRWDCRRAPCPGMAVRPSPSGTAREMLDHLARSRSAGKNALVSRSETRPSPRTSAPAANRLPAPSALHEVATQTSSVATKPAKSTPRLPANGRDDSPNPSTRCFRPGA